MHYILSVIAKQKPEMKGQTMENRKDEMKLAAVFGWFYILAGVLALVGGSVYALEYGSKIYFHGGLIIWAVCVVTGMCFWTLD